MKRSLFFIVFLIVLLVSCLVLPVYALGSVVDNYTTLSGYSVIITGYWNQLASTNAWVILTIPNASGTAQSLTLKMMKTGSPVGYYQYDLYDSSMVLVDWSIGYTIASISGVRKTSYNKAFTQSYSISNGATYYVGIRAINATLLDSNNYIQIDYDGSASETLKDHNGVNWYTDSNQGIYFIFYATVTTTTEKSFFGTASLTFASTGSKAVSFNRHGTATLTFTTLGTYSKTSLLNLIGSAILSFVSGISKALGFNRGGTATLNFASNMQKTVQLNRYGEAVLSFTSIGEYLGGVFLSLFGSALLTFTSGRLKLFEFWRYGSSTLTFATVSEKAMSFARYGASSLTFISEAVQSLARTLTFGGLANLSFLSEQLRTFTFNRYGTAPLSFTVEGIAQGLGRLITFFGSATFTFTIQKTVIMVGETLQNAKIFVAATFIMAILIGIPLLVLVMSRRRS